MQALFMQEYLLEISELFAKRPYRFDDMALDFTVFFCNDMITGLQDFLIILQ
jgi:hypothetical protein